MKTYLLLFALLGFTALTGCSADDLAGPDAAATDAALARASQDDARTSRPLSLMGAWRASDRLGTITLFLTEPDTQPPSAPSAAQPISGKGIVSGLLEAPFAVSVEGERKDTNIAFVLTDAQGDPIVKADGAIATDASTIKVVSIDRSGQQRHLVFERF